MPEKIIQQFRDAKKDGLKVSGGKSVSWINSKIKDALNGKSKQRPLPGRMYIYMYDAKYKDQLPLWDRFPLIICLESRGNKILGLNLHYLPPKGRQKFLEGLLKSSASTRNLTSKTKVRSNWNALKRIPVAKHMVKVYLASHIESQVIEIPPEEWVNAIYLPTAQFIRND